ncbi:MAG TPA: hypothetical protein VHV75_12215 [Solirubrobacteraceae bacterium]|jgi:hypothetical protein|nr:hypothetical protein [Solirubrobacteraceae bacterium]
MRRALIAVLAAGSLSLVSLLPAATSAAASAAAATCSKSYVSATIGGVHKCLRRGEYCAHRYATQYKRYGYQCVIKSGAYHLEPKIARHGLVVA